MMTKTLQRCTATVFLGVGAASVSVLAQPGITDLGLVPGAFQSWAFSVNDDGSVITGHCEFGMAVTERPVFRWTIDAGMENLGPAASGAYAHGFSVNGDGSVIAGFFSVVGYRPFRWTRETGLFELPLPAGALEAWAFAVSRDGSTLCGEAFMETATHAFRWTQAGGTQDLGNLTPGVPGGNAQLRAVSADGAILAGWSYTPTSLRAVRWTESTGMRDLGALPQGDASRADAISADGSVIAGWSAYAPNGQHAVRWVNGQIQDLGGIPNWANYGVGVSGNGAAVVGYANPSGGWPRAIMWTAELGMVDLNVYLPSVGVSLQDWFLLEARDASHDGTVVVGTGFHSNRFRGFRLRLPVRPCYSNCDRSTQEPILGPSDFACFLQRFLNGESYANCDNSTITPILNVADFTCFIQRFAAGCE